MQYRLVGGSGLRLSAVSLGSWLTLGQAVDQPTTGRLIRRALDHGINFFDTADVYAGGEAESALGAALADVPRQSWVVASKCFFPTGPGPNDRGLSRKHINESCHASLRRLRVEVIDLYQCHRFDSDTPLLETITAFTDLVRSGKILYWGVSQWTAEQIAEAIRIAGAAGLAPPISDQARYNLLDREIEQGIAAVCARHRLGILAYSPLAQGVLSGKYSGGRIPAGSRASDAEASRGMKWRMGEADLARADRVASVAREAAMPSATLALAWCLRDLNVATVITGASNEAQIDDNVRAAEVVLEPDMIRRLEEAVA